MPMATKHAQVEEMQGLYGPFTIAERVVQKIWLRRDFEQTGLQLLDGRTLLIRAPGTWNLLGGPDFHDARLVVDGVVVTGDVEVHFHSGDWHVHRHADDQAYDNVALHVILFPPGQNERRALRRDGREIAALVLLPWLHRGLEEYASDEVLEKLTEQDAAEKISALAAMGRTDLEQVLRHHAMLRWRMKVHFAALRIKKLGWTEAAHHAALEILGYKRNRAPMLGTATIHPLHEWAEGLEPAMLVAERRAEWQLQGMRPANHPLGRLRQYSAWVQGRPAWPAILKQVVLDGLPADSFPISTTAARKYGKISALRERWADALTGAVISGSRFDTLVCDGFLPLVTTETKADLSPLWFHWFLGDVPDNLRKALVMLGLGGHPQAPFCHGWAQGFLGWLAEQEARASRWPTENLPELDKHENRGVSFAP
jgi:hypothetical protein